MFWAVSRETKVIIAITLPQSLACSVVFLSFNVHWAPFLFLHMLTFTFPLQATLPALVLPLSHSQSGTCASLLLTHSLPFPISSPRSICPVKQKDRHSLSDECIKKVSLLPGWLTLSSLDSG